MTEVHPYVLDIFYSAPMSTQQVILTGDFDQWEGKQNMQVWKKMEDSTLFLLRIPIHFPSKPEKLFFKFIVDGQWCCSTNYDIETSYEFKNNFLMYGPGKHTVPLRLASEPPMYFPGLSVPELKDSFMEKDLTHERSMHLEDDDTQLETEHEDEPPYQRLYDSEEEANRLGPMFGYPPSYHVRYHYDPEPLYLMHTIGLNPMDPSDPTVPLIPPPSLITSSSSHSRSLHPASPLSKSTASTSSSPKTLSLRSMLSHFLSFFTSFFHLKTNSNPSSTSSTSESG